MNSRIIRFLFGATIATAIAILLLILPTPARAGGVVTNCTEAGLDAALSGGGTVAFNCNGTNSPATIVVTSQKTIFFDTTIDGGGQITLSGGNSTRIFSVAGNFTLKNITLTLGYASGSGEGNNGGCIWSYGNTTLNKVVIKNCFAAVDGGAIHNYTGGSMTINNSLIANNTAGYDCGGICDFGASLSVNGSTIVGNVTQTHDAAGLGEAGKVVTLTNSVIMSNTAAVSGGGLYNNDMMTLNNVVVEYNHANAFGQADAGGGGIFSGAGTTNIMNATFAGNSVIEYGGGIQIYSGAAVNVTNTTFSGNSAGMGGGINNIGTAKLTNVTLSGNSANAFGGGIINDGTATLTNVTFSGNIAYNGGGFDSSSGTTTLTNVTFSGNSAANGGGGVYWPGGTMAVTNTIVADSSSGGNCVGFLGGNFNLSTDNTCGFGSGRDNINNVMLAPLGNYGGPTLTHIPLPGSPAIDHGTGTGCPSTDQRGKSRPIGLACDVGAVERQLVDFSYWLNLPLIMR